MASHCDQTEDYGKFVLGVDVGTTNIRCYVYDNKANAVGKAQEKVKLLHPEQDRVEMEPNDLWQNFKKAVKDSLESAQLQLFQITCLGLATQRSTFITWDRNTGEPFHNFITWKDRRTDKMCEEWNVSLKMRLFRFISWILYLFTRRKRFLAGSKFKLTSSMVLMRLIWVLENVPQVQKKCLKNEVLFGTIDTWLLWKLTKGKVHATDGSNACVTGFFDTFQMKWADWAIRMFHIPSGLLPCVKQSSDWYGDIHPEIFGYSIPITAVIGDQQSSMFGECCFNRGDINCTLGTGSFLNINTGVYPLVSHEESIYPLVGWTIENQTTYLAECGVSDTGTIILWAQSLGLFTDPWESSEVASSVSDDENVYFLPASKKTQTSHCTPITSSFIGLSLKTTKAHLVRSILEAVAYQVCSLFKSVNDSESFNIKTFRICGGVSNNDFIIKVMTNVMYIPISRSKHFDSTSLGAAFLAGLCAGVWKHTNELSDLQKEEQYFYPEERLVKTYREKMSTWENALSQCYS